MRTVYALWAYLLIIVRVPCPLPTEQQAGKAGGMAAFYKSYLDRDSAAHEAAVAASQSKKPVLGPSFNVAPPPKEKTEAELAAQVEAETGRRVEVNDDGQIVDKRQLMSGGLNVVSKPRTGSATSSSAAGGFAAPIAARTQGHTSDAASSGSSSLLANAGLSQEERRRQQRERQSREIERQMAALEDKRKRDAQEALEHKVQKVAKRNDETRVEKLKREAEERRLKREADAKAAAQS